jgi:hypothetical protein
MTRLVLQRGLIVTVASACVYAGKPRPAVEVQANRWLQGHLSVKLCPLTSTPAGRPTRADFCATERHEWSAQNFATDGRQAVHGPITPLPAPKSNPK